MRERAARFPSPSRPGATGCARSRAGTLSRWWRPRTVSRRRLCKRPRLGGPRRRLAWHRTLRFDSRIRRGASSFSSSSGPRDLFSSEALRPGEPIAVGTLTVVFTDLRDSTRFYREVGDAPAFGSVMEHLDVLRAAVGEEEGAVVKAMGDAIMAAFVRPVGALRAVLRVQRELASPSAGKRPLLLKAGMHSGPCIAITQNERLDYFGSTVNVAARLVDLSSGSDVVVSEAVLEDPEVAAELAGSGMGAEPFEATLKGLEGERFALFRLTAPVEARVGKHADRHVPTAASPRKR
ncbi:MAG: adenylate/guanylate cyclase domain-containing protein [Actinobacteria bacterium]|nr:MAG: adenylate/guanylate cyclase domain-containing protein [Actinomycetota bacterium]